MFILFFITVNAWDYSKQGYNWSGTCLAGSSQSPLNIIPYIATNITSANTSYWYLSLNYTDTTVINSNFSTNLYGFNFNLGLNFNIFQNFGTIQLISGSSTTIYQCNNISFHSPSEHLINGIQYPLELQIIHNNANETLILVILYQESLYNNSLLTQIINTFGSNIGDTINLRNAIDGWFAIKNFFSYQGSLTYPPCTEGITYVVYDKIMYASSDEILFFTNYLTKNSRSVMPQNSRPLAHYQGLQDNINAGNMLKIASILIIMMI